MLLLFRASNSYPLAGTLVLRSRLALSGGYRYLVEVAVTPCRLLEAMTGRRPGAPYPIAIAGRVVATGKERFNNPNINSTLDLVTSTVTFCVLESCPLQDSSPRDGSTPRSASRSTTRTATPRSPTSAPQGWIATTPVRCLQPRRFRKGV